jgi:nitric oxide reductase subunit B
MEWAGLEPDRDQGLEYLELGRLWQILLVLALFFWVALLFRGLRVRLLQDHQGT